MNFLDEVDKDTLIEYVLHNYFDEVREAVAEELANQ